MSKVKIQGNASGTGVLTVTAPNTSTDRTITLPDSTDTLAVNSDVTNKLPLAGGTLTGSLNIGSYTANSNADNLVIQEANDFTGITLAADNDQGSNIYFADPEDNNVGGITYRHSTNDMLFRVGGAEKARILSSGGITFNGDSAAANALDDYEEGTWTPTLTGTSGGPSGVNFTYRLGWYTKIGRVVTANCRVEMSSWSSAPSGVAQISGLPFSAPASSGYFSAPSVGFARNFDSDNAPKGGFIEEGNSVIRLIKANGSDARENFSQNVSAGALNGNESIFVSITYIVSA